MWRERDWNIAAYPDYNPLLRQALPKPAGPQHPAAQPKVAGNSFHRGCSPSLTLRAVRGIQATAKGQQQGLRTFC